MGLTLSLRMPEVRKKIASLLAERYLVAMVISDILRLPYILKLRVNPINDIYKNLQVSRISM